MRTETLVLKDLDDVVFENRNKEYGAYSIRKSYSKNVTTALCCNLFFIGLLFSSPYAISLCDIKVEQPLKDKRDKLVNTTTVPIIIPLEKPTAPAVRVKHARTSLLPRVVTQEVPIIDEPIAFTPGGEETGTAEDIELPGAEFTGPAEGLPAVVERPVYDFTAIMPRYDGGEEAMMKFIMDKIRYPGTARRLRIEGTVFVRFIVSYDGRITNVEVIKGISADCDKEAARVISMMRPWIPGLQNDTPVSVRMVLPIKFKLNEEQ